MLAVLGAIGTGVYKVKQWGYGEAKAECVAEDEKRAAAAEAERKRQDALREAQDKQATKRLADARKSNQALLTSLDAHIRVAKLRADCRIPPELQSDANNALSGGKGFGPDPVPGKPKPPAAPVRP